jgi:hypothetical protein
VARGHAVLRRASQVHLLARVLARSLQAIEPFEGLTRRGRSARVLASSVIDLALWRAIKKGSIGLPGRLAADVADVALWASASPSGLTSSLAAQIALEVEMGFSWGAAGAAVPALEAAVSTLARRARGWRAEPSTHLPHLSAIALGMALRRTETARHRRAEAAHDDELSAKKVRCFLAGQNDVAVGAATVIDELLPVALMLDAAGPGSPLSRVRAGWKASIAEQTATQAIYLDQALRLWQQAHNDHPDLSGYVVLSVPPGVGTTLLTAYQSHELAALLEAMSLRGEVSVEIARPQPGGTAPDRRWPGRPVDLSVNGMRVAVPGDPLAEVPGFNGTPAILAFGAVAALTPVRRHDGAVPPSWALVSSAFYLGAAIGCARRGDGEPRTRAAVSLLAGTALAASHGVICGRFARAPAGSGEEQIFPGTYGLAPAAILLAANWSEASVGARAATAAVLGSIAVTAFVSAPPPRSRPDFIRSLLWPFAAATTALMMRSGFTVETEQISARLSADETMALQAAFESGRLSVLDLVAAACMDAERLLATRVDLDPKVRIEVERRLCGIRARLEASVAVSARLAPQPW